MTTSLAMAALTVGLVALVAAVVTAPVVVGAFTAGFATAAVASLVWQRRDDDSRDDADDTERSTDPDHWAGDERRLKPVN